jgi:hypothetical protein
MRAARGYPAAHRHTLVRAHSDSFCLVTDRARQERQLSDMFFVVFVSPYGQMRDNTPIRSQIVSTSPQLRSRDSDWLRADRPRVRSSSPGGAKIFLLSTSSRPVLGPILPPIRCVPGAPSLGVERPEREADHSPRTSVEVKKMWIYTSNPPYAFMAQCLIS